MATKTTAKKTAATPNTKTTDTPAKVSPKTQRANGAGAPADNGDPEGHTPVKDMEAYKAKTLGFVLLIRGMFTKLVTMTDDQRKHSNGRFKDGEDDALRAIIAGAELRPAIVASLADQDFGDDPTTFETQLLSDRLDRRAVLVEVFDELSSLATDFGDTVLKTGEVARPPLLQAYKLLKAVSANDAALSSVLQPAIDFYGRIGKAAAKSRAAKKEAAETATATAGGAAAAQALKSAVSQARKAKARQR